MMRVKKSTHNENKQTPDCSSSSPTTHSHYSLCFAYYNYHTHSITTEISLHNFYSSFIFPHCRLKMKRLHILFPFLLLSLILVAFQQHYATSSTFQQGHFKIATAAYDTGNAGGNSQKVKRNRKEAYEQKLRKTPSGPSPVGNNRPPSKA